MNIPTYYPDEIEKDVHIEYFSRGEDLVELLNYFFDHTRNRRGAKVFRMVFTEEEWDKVPSRIKKFFYDPTD